MPLIRGHPLKTEHHANATRNVRTYNMSIFVVKLRLRLGLLLGVMIFLAMLKLFAGGFWARKVYLRARSTLRNLRATQAFITDTFPKSMEIL